VVRAASLGQLARASASVVSHYFTATDQSFHANL